MRISFLLAHEGRVAHRLANLAKIKVRAFLHVFVTRY